MSNVLIGIIGVIFFIGLAVASASFFGSSVTGSRVEAEAADYLNQSSQIARAIEQYSADNGRLPVDGSGREPVTILVAEKYMKNEPPGGRTPWRMNAAARALLTPAAGDADEALGVCVAARRKAGMTDPERVLRCDGSGGALVKTDPCCLS